MHGLGLNDFERFTVQCQVSARTSTNTSAIGVQNMYLNKK